MGTRGAFGWRLGGKDYVTYNHFDSYPEGLGFDMLAHVRDAPSLGSLAEAVARLEVKQIKEVENNPSPEDWYWLLREFQGQPDKLLDVGFIVDSYEFPHDSLFCEWAYIVNLDERVLEVYRGFQKDRGKGRYAEAEVDRHGDYHSVSLVTTFPLDDLPNEQEFIQTISEEVRK